MRWPQTAAANAWRFAPLMKTAQRQATGRRARYRHLEGGGDRRRVRAGRTDHRHRHRHPCVARHEARLGGRHRIDRALDPARGGGGRADGRLRHPLGLRVDLRQPSGNPQLARQRGDPRPRSHRRRPGAGAGGGQRGGDPGRSQGALQGIAGIPDRRPGRHPPSGRHERRAAGSERAPGHRRGGGGAEHHQVHPALRPHRGRTGAVGAGQRAKRC